MLTMTSELLQVTKLRMVLEEALHPFKRIEGVDSGDSPEDELHIIGRAHHL